MPTSTREDIRDAMLDNYQLGRRAIHDGGSVTTPADDSVFGGPAAAERIENGSELLITSGTRDGDLCRVKQRPTPSGLMTCDPPPGAALSNADTFSVLFRPVRFEGIHKSITWAVTERFFEKLLVPITSVLDGDMLRTTAATPEWVAVDGGGGANVPTLSKVAASYPLGLRVLRVAAHATGAGDYARSANIPVEENKSYYLEATGMIAVTGTGDAADAATLVLYDVTNAAAITLDNSVIDRFEPEILANSVTMPSGCEEVQIRLTCTSVSDVIDWANVIFLKGGLTEVVVQDRHATVDRLGKLFAMNGAWGARTKWEVAARPERLTEGLWAYGVSVSGKSLWYEEWRRPAALTADTSTVALDKEDVAAVAAAHLLLSKGLSRRDDWRDVYAQAVIDAGRVLEKYQRTERSYPVNPTSVALADT